MSRAASSIESGGGAIPFATAGAVSDMADNVVDHIPHRLEARHVAIGYLQLELVFKLHHGFHDAKRIEQFVKLIFPLKDGIGLGALFANDRQDAGFNGGEVVHDGTAEQEESQRPFRPADLP